MACERYEDALRQQAAGTALTVEAPRLGAPRVEPELELHLAGCARCREELEALRRTLALVDSDLRQLAAVEPSPGLAGRIRRATAEAPAQRRPTWLWPVLAAAAVLLLAVAIVTKRQPSEAPSATVESRTPQAVGTPEPPPPTPSEGASAGAVPPTAATVTPPPAAAPPRASATARRAALPEPEVLVPPGQIEALLRLAVLVNRQRVASPSLAAVDQGSPELAVPHAIDVRSVEIKPLEIVPLDAAEDSGT